MNNCKSTVTIKRFALYLYPYLATRLQYTFIVHGDLAQLYRALICLCDAAMTRLVKGAELSVTESSDLYAKGSSTGDLASGITSSSKTTSVLLGQARSEIYSPSISPLALESVSPATETFSDMTLERLDESRPASPGTRKLKDGSESIDDHYHYQQLLYSQVTTLSFKNIKELEMHLRTLEFRSIFRLPVSEKILDQEYPCYLYLQSSATPTGTLFFADEFLCFASVLPAQNVALQNLPLMPALNSQLGLNSAPQAPASSINSYVAGGNSLLFDDGITPRGEVCTDFVIPYCLITSVTKMPPTALSSRFSISISGFLSLKTRGNAEVYLSFSSTHARDRAADEVMNRMKKTDWSFFDQDVVIGSRNGNDLPVPPDFENNSPKTANEVGMRLLFPDSGGILPSEDCGDQNPARKRHGAADYHSWKQYLERNGMDVCMIKDYKRLRELILLSKYGIPTHFRGDLWMLFTGARYSRPSKSYYEKLVKEKFGRLGLFTGEIEKDVHR